MNVLVYGILETDSASSRIVNFYPGRVTVQIDDEAQAIQLEPVGGPSRIPLSERIDKPALPLHEGSMTISGVRVRLAYLGRNSGDSLLRETEHLVYGLLDHEDAERLTKALDGSW